MATTIAVAGIGTFATFGVTTDVVGAHKFQWSRDGVPIGGNDKSYTTPPLRPEDFKAKFKVVVIGISATEESNEIVLSESAKPAVPSTAPPATSTSTAPVVTPPPTTPPAAVN